MSERIFTNLFAENYEPKYYKKKAIKAAKYPPEYVLLKDNIHDTYVLFFKWVTKTDIAPVFSIEDWRNIKLLTVKLLEMCNNDVEMATETWKLILRNWNSYEKFYRSNIKLRFIHSNLENYIYQNGNKQTTQFGKSKSEQSDFGKQNRNNEGQGFGNGESVSEWVY
jgi:hypothetical protein